MCGKLRAVDSRTTEDDVGSHQNLIMLNIAAIVCAVDFSDHSKVALARAGAWAWQFKARLIVVTVVEPLLANAAATTYDMDLVRDEVLPELRALVERASGLGGAEISAPEPMVVVGEPAAEIVALAEREQADLIVIATHGLSGYRKMLVGSTTEKVLRQTTVPVLVAPRLNKRRRRRILQGSLLAVCSRLSTSKTAV